MSEQDFLNTLYPGIKSNPNLALTQDEFVKTCDIFLHKKPSQDILDKAISLGIIVG